MAKVVVTGAFKSAHGKLGEGLVLSQHGKNTILGSTPRKEHSRRRRRKPTEGEKRGNLNLRILNSYSAQTKQENPELWTRYRAVALTQGKAVNCISNADFSHPPVVDAIDARAYRGQPGQLIRIRAHDDFDVRDVTVTLRTGASTVIETGLALRQPDEIWHYTTTASVDEAGIVTIEAVARDWPDHKDTRSLKVDLTAPSVVDESPRARLVEAIRRAAQRQGTYVLPNGRTRVNFFDKYRLAHSPALLRAIAEQLLPHIPASTDCIAGLELGGIPVATHLSHLSNKPLVLLRKEARTWGTMAPAEGGDLAGRHVLPIADVVTTGTQLAASIKALRSAGAIVTHALCVIDQLSGAPGRLQKEGVALTSLFTAFELVA